MRRFIIISVQILTICFLIIPSPSLAASEFRSNFISTYTIPKSDQVSVSHLITLTNNLSHIYATSYTIATSGENLEHITASDESGEIKTTTSIQNGVTTINMVIDRPSIGKDQVKSIKLNYTTTDVVERIGDTLTINIPRLAKANEAESYTRIVKIEGLGNQSALIYPKETKIESEGDYQIYTFTAHQNDSLSLLFGESVTYEIDLTYELKNKELSAIDSELALPPDTGYQRIILDSISPKPSNISLDDNGNWLARYTIEPQEKTIVQAKLFATVYPRPTLYDPSSKILQKTHNSKYWDTNSTAVTSLAQKLKTPENMYHYLTTNFTYNYGLINADSKRQGVLAALSSPTNVLCTEFTDTFISLARSEKIPSREINGYGYTKNTSLQPQSTTSDILHAWPEYYNQNSQNWIAIDPTWGNTTGGIDYLNKLDFSHIAFVRHGSEDSYPIPPGAYKTNPEDKHVMIKVAANSKEGIPKYEIKKSGGKQLIVNTGNVALINQVVKVDGVSTTVDYLPPFGTQEIVQPERSSILSKIQNMFKKLATWLDIR